MYRFTVALWGNGGATPDQKVACSNHVTQQSTTLKTDNVENFTIEMFLNIGNALVIC